MEIRESQAVQYNRPNIEYEKQTVKVIVKADHKYQCEAVYTYDKHGQLTNTVIQSHVIGEA
jgi:hypothetical protein